MRRRRKSQAADADDASPTVADEVVKSDAGVDPASGAATAGEPVGESPRQTEPLPDVEADGGADAEGAGTAPRRRRPRGRRGGRRRRSADAVEVQTPATSEAEPPQPQASAGREDDASVSGESEPRKETGGAHETGVNGSQDGSATETAPKTRSRRGRRRRKPKDADGESTAAAQAGSEAGEEAAGAAQAGDQVPAVEPETPEQPAKTARRSRRKRADKSPAEATAAAAAEAPPEQAAGRKRRSAKRAAGDETEDRPHREAAPKPRSRRGRSAARPAPEAGAERTILASEDLGDLRVAVVEDGRLVAVYLERQERPSILGNIYQARVQSVLKGMDAAFIDFGLEKNGFLHVDEVSLPDEDGGSRRSRRINQLLRPGQEILVQVSKDPMKGKGARLTTRVSLPGRYLVYVPGGSGVGVSRRLAQDERDRLRDLCKQLQPKNAGLIVRTVAEGRGLEDLRRDLQYLSRLWSRIKRKGEKSAAPALIHEEVDVALTAARDLVDESCRRFVVDSSKARKRIVAYLERVAPELADRVELHEGDEPLFEEYGVEDGIDATLARRVPLQSGGNLVIDHTEALTVIDVNSGRYTGGSGLEETITKTNLEAAEEIVRQLRLRDIGGIIVIDFIDMLRRENREAVLQKLESALARDKTKTYVVEISPLGLVEMTRQSTTDGTRGLMTVTCPTCNGTARVLSADSMVRDVQRLLTRTLPGTPGEAALIEVRRDVAERLLETDRIRRLERLHGKRLFFEGSAELPVDTFRVVSSGPLRVVEGQRLPVHEEQELEVELRHTVPYSPRDAVAVVDGYQLVVRGGRQHLGSVRRVRVESALRCGGVATLL